MAGNRTIDIGRDANANIMVTGDQNRISGTNVATWRQEELTSAAEVDIEAELATLKTALESFAVSNKELITAAITEARVLSAKTEPPKDKIASALERAIGYAGSGGKLAEHGQKLWPTLRAIGGWLGAHAPVVLRAVGIGLS